jgi:hypothetical protein
VSLTKTIHQLTSPSTTKDTKEHEEEKA